MSAEIKSLDSDMQMLVYENYNKFICATDTIRTMKSSVDDMDGKMQTLKQLIGQLTVDFLQNLQQDMSCGFESNQACRSGSPYASLQNLRLRDLL